MALLRLALLFVLLVKNCVYGQFKLISSSSEGFVCENSHVTFSCETPGTFLTWFVDGQRVGNYPGNSIQPYDSDVYSVLLSSDNSVLLSELIFLVSPRPPSFQVQCLSSGSNSGTLSIKVLANHTISAPNSMTHSVSGLTLTLFWNHDQSAVIKHFEIMLGNDQIVAKGSQTQIEIRLPECKDFEVRIVAVDFCDNRNTSERFYVNCSSNTSTTTITTSTATTSTATTPTATSSDIPISTPSPLIVIELDVKEVKKIVISTLFFVLLHLVIYVAVQIYCCRKKKRGKSVAVLNENMKVTNEWWRIKFPSGGSQKPEKNVNFGAPVTPQGQPSDNPMYVITEGSTT